MRRAPRDIDIASLIDAATAKFGSQAKLAKAAGISQAGISHAKIENRVSAELAVIIDKATNGEVSKSDLRPDLWPREAAE